MCVDAFQFRGTFRKTAKPDAKYPVRGSQHCPQENNLEFSTAEVSLKVIISEWRSRQGPLPKTTTVTSGSHTVYCRAGGKVKSDSLVSALEVPGYTRQQGVRQSTCCSRAVLWVSWFCTSNRTEVSSARNLISWFVRLIDISIRDLFG